MRNLVRRVKRLEHDRFAVTGLVPRSEVQLGQDGPLVGRAEDIGVRIPHSKAWLDYWTDKFCRFVNGEDVDFTGGTLDCLDAVMALGEAEEKKANSSGWT